MVAPCMMAVWASGRINGQKQTCDADIVEVVLGGR